MPVVIGHYFLVLLTVSSANEKQLLPLIQAHRSRALDFLNSKELTLLVTGFSQSLSLFFLVTAAGGATIVHERF
jgi:hypothetical protein